MDPSFRDMYLSSVLGIPHNYYGSTVAAAGQELLPSPREVRARAENYLLRSPVSTFYRQALMAEGTSAAVQQQRYLQTPRRVRMMGVERLRRMMEEAPVGTSSTSSNDGNDDWASNLVLHSLLPEQPTESRPPAPASSFTFTPRSMPQVFTGESRRPPPPQTWSHSGQLETIDLTEEAVGGDGAPSEARRLRNIAKLPDKELSDDVRALLRHQCPICLDSYRDILRGSKALSATSCGHVFCKRCIYSAMSVSRQCPTCRTPLSSMDSVHPLYLPFV